MRKSSFYLFLILTTFLLYACPPIEPNPDPTDVVCTANLENITLGVDTTYVPEDGNGVNIGLVWDAIDSAVTYTVVIEPGEQSYTVQAPQTSVLASTNLELNQPFSASLTAQMQNKATCGPILYKSIYCNGGGTVDDVYRTVDWDNICNNSECDFLRFRSRDIEDCDGNLVDPLPWRLRGGTYYKRADVCDCLTNGGTLSVCDGVKDLRLNPCLESLEKCLKHDYLPCGE